MFKKLNLKTPVSNMNDYCLLIVVPSVVKAMYISVGLCCIQMDLNFGLASIKTRCVRRSVAKRGGCFQRRRFVCQCVCVCVCVFLCPHDNFRKTKRRAIKLGD